MGQGFRDSREEELIQFNENDAYVRGQIEVGAKMQLQIFLKRTSTGVTKTYSVNKVKKRHDQYLLLSTRSVLFSPDQIFIMIGPPDVRRSYFDRIIFSFDTEYRKRLTNYENALRRRNKVLEKYTNIAVLKEELSFWDVYLTEQASYITKARDLYVDFLNGRNTVEEKVFHIEHIKNEFTLERLEETSEEERRYRKTQIGPQKDDYIISQIHKGVGKSLHHFGSRSEQRLAVYWLKLCEAHAYEEKLRLKPILLLDDIFSELDGHNKRLTLKTIHEYQTILTTTEPETVELVKKDKKVILL